MPFSYYGGEQYGQPAPLSYEQQQQEQGGIDPMQMLQQANQMGLFDKTAMVGGGQAYGGLGGIAGAGPTGSFTGGGTMLNASGQAVGSLAPQGAPVISGQFGGGMFGGGGSAAAGGGGGGGGALAAAGPWALLAAAVIGNEVGAKEAGRRGDSTEDWVKDAFGKGLSKDTNYYTEKVFGKDLENDYIGIGADMQGATELMSGDFSNAWSAFKEGTAGKSITKPFEWIGDMF